MDVATRVTMDVVSEIFGESTHSEKLAQQNQLVYQSFFFDSLS